MFVHLNLAIALLLGYLIFMFGIETATGSAVSIAATIKISISSYVGLDSNTNEAHIFADNIKTMPIMIHAECGIAGVPLPCIVLVQCVCLMHIKHFLVSKILNTKIYNVKLMLHLSPMY